MAKLVSGFLMPHDPLVAAIPLAAPKVKRDAVMNGFSTVCERISAQRIDTVIVVADDHATVNGPSCVPMAMIGIGDVEGPKEPWLGIERAPIDNNEALAQHIAAYGWKNGVDWALSKSLLADHSFTIPVHFAVRPVAGVRAIPVYLNSGMEPVISSRRAFEIGMSIGEAVAASSGDERVAIYGTGGISHWPSTAQMGRVNEDWDRMIIDMVIKGDVEGLIGLSDESIMRDGGNGGLEIKNFLCAMGAFAATTGETIAYESVPEWVSGLGFMELKA
jgi:protocatechuate 4,5-dioxygenase beta chain